MPIIRHVLYKYGVISQKPCENLVFILSLDEAILIYV